MVINNTNTKIQKEHREYSDPTTKAERPRRLVRLVGEEEMELVWELPLHMPYFKSLLESKVADFKNADGREAHSIQGALFLVQFVDKPWLHLDIAGPAIPEKSKPWCDYPITGFGARLLAKFVEEFQ